MVTDFTTLHRANGNFPSVNGVDKAAISVASRYCAYQTATKITENSSLFNQQQKFWPFMKLPSSLTHTEAYGLEHI